MWSPINSNFIPVISSQLYDEGPDVPVDGSVVSVGESVWSVDGPVRSVGGSVGSLTGSFAGPVVGGSVAREPLYGIVHQASLHAL